jgi:glycosyltransferase involved in cell wall biosynthesis
MTLAAQRLAGYEVAVITSLGFPRYKGVETIPGREPVDGVTHHRLDWDKAVTGSERVPFDLLLEEQALRTAEIADHEKPAIIQVGSGFRGYDQALVGLAVASRAGLPLIYEVRGFFESTWTGDSKWAESGEYFHRRRRQDLRCLEAADHVVTIADAMRDEIVSQGFDPAKVSVVPNVVDVDRFSPRDKSTDLIARLRIRDQPIVGYISNLGPREGVEYLIRATQLLKRRGSNVTCLIVGDGPERPRLADLAGELAVDDDVILTGHVPNAEIEDYYALMDIFVIPRVDDRQARLVTPLKPLEAMAMGIPVVVSDLPALRELAAPGDRGLTATPESSESLAETLQAMLDDVDLRTRLAANARSWVVEHRTLSSNVERYRKALLAVS